MNGQESVLLLRRIEQAIYGLEKRLVAQQPLSSTEPRGSQDQIAVEFPSVIGVEVAGGTINAIVEEQPIRTLATLTTELATAPVSVNLSSAGDIALIAAPTGTAYQIYQITLVNNGTLPASFRLQDNNSVPVVFTGVVTVPPNGAFTLTHLYPFIQLNDGRALVLQASTAAQLGGCIFYRAVSV